MKIQSLVLFYLLTFSICSAQKPNVNFDTYKTWSWVNSGDLTQDGRYAMYSKGNVPLGKNTLNIVTATGTPVYQEIGMNNGKFSQDSRYAVGISGPDSLAIVSLEKGTSIKLPSIQSYELEKWGKMELIFANLKNGDLQLIDFSGNVKHSWDNIQRYEVAQDGGAMLLIQKDTADDGLKVLHATPIAKSVKQIYSGSNVSDIVHDIKGTQWALIDRKDGVPTLLYFQNGMDRMKVLPTDSSKEVVAGDYWAFSGDGKRLFYSIAEKISPGPKFSSGTPEIWNYQDKYLRSYYKNAAFNDRYPNPACLHVIDLSSKRSTQLLQPGQTLESETLKPSSDEHLVFKEQDTAYYLLNTKTGSIDSLEKNQKMPSHFWGISPRGRFVIYYSLAEQGYVCFDIQKKVKRILNRKLNITFTVYTRLHYAHPTRFPQPVLGWLPGDRKVVISSTYDIISFDPQGESDPINVTQGIGAREQIIFMPTASSQAKILDDKVPLLLYAFNVRNMDCGFYKSSLDDRPSMEKLSMDAHASEQPNTPLSVGTFIQRKGGFLVLWRRADQAPNFYYSRNLKSFRPLSDIQPQKNLNWIIAELHTYKDKEGNELKGVLYKPENFDSSKKYPVIFNPYEFRSQMLHNFPSPDLRGTEVISPLMVSNGYLVFLPDIRTDPKHGGDGAVRSINAAIDHLNNFSWVDSTKLGLIGHSVGGFIVNYTVTHTNRFKAAVSGAGISDMVRAATDLWSTGESKQEFLKEAVYMMENEFPDDPENYIRNSAIYSAKRLTTPLLLYHNDQDGSVNYLHSRSLFIILRSLNKPCWWLNYSGQGHSVIAPDLMLDYSTRVWQFFNHYLKGKPMPEWMKEHN